MGAAVPALAPHVFQPVPLCLERLWLPAGSPQGTRGEGGRELWDLARYLSHPLHVETIMALKVQVNLTDSAMKSCCGIHKYQESYLQETLADTQCTSPCWSCKIFEVVFKIQKDTKLHKKTHWRNCLQSYRVADSSPESERSCPPTIFCLEAGK